MDFVDTDFEDMNFVDKNFVDIDFVAMDINSDFRIARCEKDSTIKPYFIQLAFIN